MNFYKTAISVLVLAPVVGGVSVHMIHNYQNMKEQAEELASRSEESIKAVEVMLEEGDTADIAGAGEYQTDGTEWEELLADEFCLEEIQMEGYEEDFSAEIASQVIRFHIRANSDSEEDQALKLQVRDAILEEIAPALSQADSKEEARAILEEHLSDMEETGAEVIQAAGYDYDICAYLTTEEFPMKSYGDLLFPAGEYEALRIDIGKKNGGNWWCVMYPGLCFVDTAGGVVATEGKEELQRVLTPEEYEELLICPEEDTRIEYRSLLWDTFFR